MSDQETGVGKTDLDRPDPKPVPKPDLFVWITPHGDVRYVEARYVFKPGHGHTHVHATVQCQRWMDGAWREHKRIHANQRDQINFGVQRYDVDSISVCQRFDPGEKGIYRLRLTLTWCEEKNGRVATQRSAEATSNIVSVEDD